MEPCDSIYMYMYIYMYIYICVCMYIYIVLFYFKVLCRRPDDCRIDRNV
jgi:hypothetical protein